MEKMNYSSNKKRSRIMLIVELLKLIRPLALYMFLAVSAGVLGFLAAIFIPIFGTYALFGILGVDVPFSFGVLITLCLVLGVVRGFLRYSEQLCNHFIAFKVLAIMRDRIFAALRKLAPAKLETKEKGTLISMITSDVEIMEVFYAHTVSPILIASIVSLIMTIFIGSFHWVLGCAALSAYVFVGLVLPLYVSKIGQKAGEGQRKNFSRLNDYMFDTLQGMREVFQFGAEGKRLDTIDQLGKDLRKSQRKLKKYGLTTNLLNSFSLMFFPSLMLISGGYLYQQGTIEFRQILIPLIALLASFGPVIALSNVANTLLLTFASGHRIIDLIEEKPQVDEIIDSKDIEFNDLVCDQVSFAYGKEEILKDISLKIEKDNILAITGKSGAGKSTLLKLMMRFWETDKGEISISGTNINEVNTRSLRKNQSYLTQFPVLLNESIADNIRLGKSDATMEEIEEAANKASIHDFIQRLENGYDTRVGELGDRLSSGEKQRINLARLFLHDAPLILLDEPTSNVDSLNEGIILKSIQETSSNKAIVLVTHRRSTSAIAENIFEISGN